MGGSPASLPTSEPTETPAPSSPGNLSWLLSPHTSFSLRLPQILLGWVGIPQRAAKPVCSISAPNTKQRAGQDGGGPIVTISALLCDLGKLLVISSLAVLDMEGGTWR